MKPSDMNFSPGLTGFALEYQEKQFIADQVVPPMPHSHMQGKYKSYSQFDVFDIEGGQLGPSSHADEVDFDVSETSFSMDNFGYKGWVSQQAIDNAEAPIQPMRTMTRRVMQKTLRRRERRVALAVMGAGNYATPNKNDEAGTWATLTTDVWGRLLTGMDACAAPPNVLVMDLATFRAVQRNQTVLAAIKGTLAPQFVEGATGPAKTGSAFIPQSVFCPALAQALGLDRVVVGAAQFASSKKGQALARGRIWDLPNAGKGGAALVRVAQDQVEDLVTFLHLTFKEPFRVYTWFDPDRGADGSTAVKVVDTGKVIAVANDAGYLFQDTLVT
jgi:hypothetical protein